MSSKDEPPDLKLDQIEVFLTAEPLIRKCGALTATSFEEAITNEQSARLRTHHHALIIHILEHIVIACRASCLEIVSIIFSGERKNSGV
jgi:hypothetical protein